MKLTEKIFATLSLIGLTLNLLNIPGGTLLMIFTISMLSIIYMYFGFAFFNGIRLRHIFKKEAYKGVGVWRILGSIGTGITLSILLISIMFRIQSWPGASVSLIQGALFSLIIFIVGLIKFSKSKSNFYKRIFLRLGTLTGIVIILFLIPKMTLIEIKYSDYPAYIDAIKEARSNPDSLQLWDKVDLEYQKMMYPEFTDFDNSTK